MKDAAKELEFEEAAKYRDRIQSLRKKLLGRESQAQRPAAEQTA